ncbi:bifunctional folylpolyglutamate synthase/dihydrofolate synthase [Geobacillus thermoleovorans]|uniref:bifunctional folylpolyglutamate synthase/dihydrofolate synthase n=1 Tax=Geobacillus thermoleovorans TaxID=33941 RepID=UPI003DA28303
MVRTYEEAVAWIHGRLRLGMKPGLKRMEWMMEQLGHPERRVRAVHIGGTNGKGSTVAYLRSILQAAGYSVGTFTSPYVEQFNERISINGEPISDQEIVELVRVIQPLADELEQTEFGGPTEFEVITAMMLYYFGKQNIQDIVLIEVGLGGRLDSTNIIYPLVSVITNVSYDHMNILGDTLGQIAAEKAGIIKSGVPLVTAVKEPEAWEVIAKTAAERKAKTYRLGVDFTVTDWKTIAEGEQFSLATPFAEYRDLRIQMPGAHQVDNAAVAVMAAELLRLGYSFLIEPEHIADGLATAAWPGRFERVSGKPLIILDGAHNEAGIRALVETVRAHYPDKRVHVLFAALTDKPLERMIQLLDELADTITFTTFDFPRAAAAEQLTELSTHQQKAAVLQWEKWIREQASRLTERDLLLITGSLYFISEVKKGMR